MVKNKINVGVIGIGTIGQSVVKLLLEKRGYFRDKSGIDLNLCKVCDKDLSFKKDIRIPKKMFTWDFNNIINDPDIDIVVELIGGLYPAKEIVMKALESGKHVVTANKLLLAAEGENILKKAEEMDKKVFFEASVAGGVPIINSIREGLIANTFSCIFGILNGTSNYVLSEMADKRVTFENALKEAQTLGYAERDPSLDIKGLDSAHKIAILSFLAFGKWVNMKDIYVEGIEKISPVDIEYAKESGYVVKLLAIAKRNGEELEVRVHPTLLLSNYILSSVSGVYNAIFIDADLVGKQLFYGQGAGKLPTASAILSDIMNIASTIYYGRKSAKIVNPERVDVKRIKKIDDICTRYYLHFSTVDKPGVLAKIAEQLGKYNISIASVVQKERREGRIVPIVMLTHEARELDIQQALKEINRLQIIRKKSVFIRIEG